MSGSRDDEDELVSSQLITEKPTAAVPVTVPPLLELVVASLVENIHAVESFGDVPEGILCGLFEVTLARGKLTERLLDAFLATSHPQLIERVQQLKIRAVPPVLPITRNQWLGDKPSLY